jgi:phosphoketolase
MIRAAPQLLRKPLELSHVKPLVAGHWGTTLGQNFIYVHLNRVIKKYDLAMFYSAVPGHGGVIASAVAFTAQPREMTIS